MARSTCVHGFRLILCQFKFNISILLDIVDELDTNAKAALICRFISTSKKCEKLTEKKQIYSYLSKMGDYVKTNVNEHCFKNNIDAQVIGIGSKLRIVHTKNFIKSRRERDSLEIGHKIISDFYDSLLKRNIFVNSNKIIFLSMMHTEDIVNEITTSIIESIK